MILLIGRRDVDSRFRKITNKLQVYLSRRWLLNVSYLNYLWK